MNVPSSKRVSATLEVDESAKIIHNSKARSTLNIVLNDIGVSPPAAALSLAVEQ